MADIEFDRLDILVGSIEPSRIIVKWQLKPTVIPLSRYIFIIEKSENSIEGFRELVRFAGHAKLFYEDYSSELLSVNRQFWYRIKALNTRDNTEIITRGYTWEDYPDLKSLEVMRLLNYLLEFRTGTPNFLFTERTSGIQCPHCWDVATSRVTNPDCGYCMGTGKLGGYYDPVLIWADLNPQTTVSAHIPIGETQTTDTQVLLNPFPEIKPRDVILEALSERKWRVMRVNRIESNRVSVQQVAQLAEINKTDVEYRLLSIPDNIRIEAIARYNERKPLREW